MEAPTLDINCQEGPAFLVKKTPAGSSAQEFQAEGNSLFAGMLEQKISEGTSSGSASGPATAAKDGKRTPPPALKGMMIAGKGEPATGEKPKPAADLLPGSPLRTKEPIDGAAAEGKPFAVPAEKLSLPLTEKSEADGAADAAIQIEIETTAQAAGTLAGAAEKESQADPAPAENDARPIMHALATDMALFAQSLQPREAGLPGKEAVTRLTGKCFENDTEIPATGKLFRKESPAPVSGEPLLPSGDPADHAIPFKGSEHATEPSFIPEGAETAQLKNGEAAAAAADLTRKANEAAAAVTPDPTRKIGETAAGANLDLRRAGPLAHNDGKRPGDSKEGTALAAAPQKTTSAVHDGEPALEQTTPAGSASKTLPAGNIAAEAATAVRDHQQIRGTAARHSAKRPEGDLFPFRMEMPNAASLPPEAAAAVAAGPSGAEMQGVIDQIWEARQTMGNDSGRIRILLNPPNLGAVDLEIIVRGERVEVVMTAENATVQQALQSRGDDIRISLQRQDLKIEGFQVLLQENGTSEQQAHGGAMYRQDREHRERFGAGEDVAPALPALSSAFTGIKSAEGRVSIFA